MTRNQQILAMRGKKSYGVIAQELGVTRNVVAGVCFRADHPKLGARSPGSRGKNKTGSGYRMGVAAEENLWREGALKAWETRRAAWRA